jgi:hypothetical protein
MEFTMLSDAVIILANMRGGYAHVGSTVHTLFRMSDRPQKKTKEVDSAPSEAPAAIGLNTNDRS